MLKNVFLSCAEAGMLTFFGSISCLIINNDNIFLVELAVPSFTTIIHTHTDLRTPGGTHSLYLKDLHRAAL